MKKFFLVFLFGLILFGLIWLNWQMRNVLFYDWDEAMYAQIAREMIRNKKIVTTFNNQLWFDKPPLSYLIVALSFFIVGENEFFSRLMMVLLGFCLITLLYFLARKITKNTTASLIPIMLLAASPIFLERSTILNSDLLVAISWVGYFLFWENFWLKLLFLTIGVFGKSVLGFYPIVFETFYHLINFFVFKKKLNINLKKVFLLIFIPSLWYLFNFLKFGQEFVYHHFLSQMFKRLVVPIELHFGDKFFHFNLLWKNLGYFNFLMISGYLYLCLNLKNEWRKNLKNILILISPLPFLALLTVMRTKIDWYLVIYLPLLLLSISYFYERIDNRMSFLANSAWRDGSINLNEISPRVPTLSRDLVEMTKQRNFLIIKLLKSIIIISSILFFLVNFTKQTFFSSFNYQPPEKVTLALCLSKTKEKNVGVYVDEQERRNRNFLEAAHYQTTSSFYYGGSPAFVFYLNKPLNFFYDDKDFVSHQQKYQTLVLTKVDYNNLKEKINYKKIVCETKNWISLKK
jgi:4-amino-4-deoxy-L-arabinose transferase-like glycosyltransferase